jgi:putative ABC transport system substrate-binding protein
MRRRDFLGILVGSAAAWPLAADAQQPSIPVVGFVNSSTAQAQVLFAAAYRRGLEESGFIEGKNVLIESRWADGQYNRLPELIGDLIKRNVAVLMAGGPPAAIAAKKPPQRYPLCLQPETIPSRWVSSRALIDHRATLLGSMFFSPSWSRKSSDCYAKWCQTQT